MTIMKSLIAFLLFKWLMCLNYDYDIMRAIKFWTGS